MSRNKSSMGMVLTVAKWEFGRWFKIKEQILTILFGALLSLLIFGGVALLAPDKGKPDHLTLVNPSGYSFRLIDTSAVLLHPVSDVENDPLMQRLESDETDGILFIISPDSAVLTVKKDPAWSGMVQASLNAFRMNHALQQSGLNDTALQNIFAPMNLSMNLTEDAGENASASEKVTAGVFIGLMMVGIFLGLACQFVAITGEKQLRITEVIVSAISPQTWIDGKILGISLLSLALMITYSLTSVIFVIVSSLLGSNWSLPVSLSNPLLVLQLLLLSISGFFFWNTFLSAVAATINDPNTSARGSLIMVPVLPVTLAFFAFGNPDSLFMIVMSLFPVTAAPVMSARLVLTQVSVWEFLAALLLLNGATWLLRHAAGKIFSLSILMYGKEASLGEIARWLKKS